MTARIEKALVPGMFSLDWSHVDVESNLWLVFQSGPGATGRSFCDRPTILDPIHWVGPPESSRDDLAGGRTAARPSSGRGGSRAAC